VSESKSSILGDVVVAQKVSSNQMEPNQIRNIILLLSGSVALMMTGYGIIMPVFARRLGEFGDGIQELGTMTMAFALAQLIGAPLWGGVADRRRGRRPIILLALTAVTLAYIGYLLASNTVIFIAIRAAAGFMTAGLFPAAMGVVADIVTEQERARWVGIVMGSYAVGMIFGPVLGGFLYDTWGYAAPFILSAVVAGLATLAAFSMIPETHTQKIRWRETLLSRRIHPLVPVKQSLWAVLPRPISIIGTLLFIDFIGSFAFAFVEPQMIFYFYDNLLWTTVQFGVVVGAYGIVMVLGQMFLGALSDRWGRKPVILVGLLPNLIFFACLAVLTDYRGLIIAAAIAGLGQSLVNPAASAFYLDITSNEHRSRVVGVKESSLALGGVLGPLAVAAIAPLTTPQGIFWIASILVLVSVILGVVLLREPRHTQAAHQGVQEEISNQRGLAAQASLRSIIMMASTSRRVRRMN
jgi:MFS family permease